jgi:hypothetical protein
MQKKEAGPAGGGTRQRLSDRKPADAIESPAIKQAPAKSWRDVLPVHPAADLFPLMSETDPAGLKEMGEDIEKRGLVCSVVLSCEKPPRLVDGRNRLDAMEQVGIRVIREGGLNHELIHSITLPSDIDPYEFVLSVNIHRRHLSAEKKREVIAEQLKANPEKSNRQIAELAKDDHKKVGRVRDALEATGALPQLSKTVGKDGKARNRPAAEPVRGRGERHVCWQCRARAPVGEVQQHSYPAYEDVDVWLHDSCVAAFEALEAAAAADSGPATGNVLGPKISAEPSEVEELRDQTVVNGGRAIMASRREPDDSLDYSPTPPWATRALIERVFPAMLVPRESLTRVCEPACGEGHMAEVLAEYFGRVDASDVHDYGYGTVANFLTDDFATEADWFISNPPFGSKAESFALKMLERARVGVAVFARLQWLETIGRYERLFRDQPPTQLAFFCERVNLCMGRWEPDGGTATAYIWLVWVKGLTPRPPFWIPPGCREQLSSPDDIERFTTHPVTPRDPLALPGFLRRTAP